jgi:hypothetical protein
MGERCEEAVFRLKRGLRQEQAVCRAQSNDREHLFKQCRREAEDTEQGLLRSIMFARPRADRVASRGDRVA